ncbi:MucR family transcriptional regulator [Microvirga massiliensis]|uniref:MucR family transcriptional regulator n=1 Tax=Microvirga massiliensis TaxID=1033741 RepID=UPI00062B3C78
MTTVTDQAVSHRSAIALAAEIVSSFVSSNPVPRTDLPALIGSVHAALQKVASPAEVGEPKPTPAVPVKKSITVDFLISLEDGRPYKSLKRHLTRLGLTSQQYREKWGLPADYPMVAPSYAAQRSELAKNSGLGRKNKVAVKSAAPSPKITAPAVKKPVRKKVR